MFIHSFIQAISIVPLEVRYYSEGLPTQHGYCVGVQNVHLIDKNNERSQHGIHESSE